MISLNDKQILVTGATSGIGRKVARMASQLGARVIACGRNPEQLQKTLELLEGSNHLVAEQDLSQTDSIPDWILGLAKEHGRIDGLVHMAGVHGARPLRVTDEAFVDQLFKVNVASAIGLAKGVRHKKVRGEQTSIVFASSVTALAGEAGISVYSATKGAIISLTRSLAIELAREKIRVNCVSPAIVKTEMTEKFHETFTPEQIQEIESKHPLGFGAPGDVAGLVMFLLSDSARWMTGSNLVIDGGYSAQ